MRLGTSYKQNPIEGDFDAIVIGSGIGGLGAAALLAKHANQKVLVLERHYTAGGYTHTFSRRGYEWDVGVHYIGEVLDPNTELRAVFDDITDGQLEWADMGEVYDTIIIGEDRYEFVKGIKNFRARMIRYFPDEEEAIDRYLKRIKTTLKKGQLYFTDKALPGFVSTLIGPLLRMRALKEARRTTAEVLEEITDNPRLRAVLAGQFGDYGLPPSEGSFFVHAMVANHYFEGGAYPVGGSKEIARNILPVIERTGGQVFTNVTVEEILVENNRAVGVRLHDGKELRAKTIISDAGLHNTIHRLLPEAVADRHGLRERTRAVPPSIAHLSLYLGYEQTAEELGLQKSNLWVFPTDDHDKNMSHLFEDAEAPLPAAYLSFPGAKDPDFTNRYPGKTTVEVVTLVPYAWFKKWEDTRWGKRGDDYKEFKAYWTDRLLASLHSQCPQLKGKEKHCELSTPLSTKHFANFAQGEIYGLAQTPERFEQSWIRPQTPIRGLYLTGADVCSPGVAGGLFGSVLCVSSLLLRDMRAACFKSVKKLRAQKQARPVLAAQNG